MSPDVQRLAMRHLGSSLLIALIMILLGAGLLWASRQSLAQARSSADAARSEAQKQHDRYLAVSRDEAIIRQTIARFDALTQQGLIGPENRLDWANALRNAALKHRIEHLEFSIEPQRSLGKLDTAGQFHLNASQMKLSLNLLHEGEILRLLEDLGSRSDAMLFPQHCLLRKISGQKPGETNAVRAECKLDWITISPPASPTPPGHQGQP